MPVRGVFGSIRDGGWVPWYDPSHDPIKSVTSEHALAFDLVEVVAWGLTITFALSDLLTTVLGLPHPLLFEAVPSTLWVVEQFGWPGLAVKHALTIGLLAAMWQLLPRPYRVVVPLEGAFAGYMVTHSNLVTLLSHGVLLAL